MRGRLASLLEVGTGFHPDLSGRDNIFLNGAILGMTRSGLSDDASVGENIWPGGRLFHLFAAATVVLIVAVVTPAVDTIMADAGFAVTNGSLLLIGMGLLQLGVSARILRVAIG